jgi:signal transduction histidine kinase
VRDEDVVYIDPLLGDLAPHDRVLVALEAPDGFTQRYVLATAAPGAFSPVDASNGATAGRLRAYWQSVPHGYQLELRAPLGLIGARFGFAVVDADATGDVATAGTLRGLSATENATPGVAFPPSAVEVQHPALHFEGTPGLLVYAPAALRSSLATFAPSDRRLRVTDKSGFELASVGALAPLDEADPDDEDAASGGALAVFYRLLLDRDIAPPPSDPRTGRAAAPGVQSALAGRAAAGWYRPAEGSKAIVAAAQPIRAGGELLGAVVLEQTSDAILTLTNHALVRLVNVTLLASLAAAAALLGYATWLSLRIRGLRNAAERALDARGRIAVDLPEVRAGDELGDLARGFAVLLGRLREHTDYLQTLASKLSHELRTPLAVVQSSLENLTQHPLESQAAVYADRAQEGTARLRAILTAMSEATRVEQSIRGVQLERFDACELLRGTVAAYRDVYRDRRIELALPDSPCELGGAPELLVQMLDKLVENAVDFTAPGGRIDVSLANSRESFRLSVANEGPPLPARMQGRIFDSLVSMREQRGERPHLGLGLHIARLIADAHGATIEAHDLPDARGVEFTVTFPRA